MKKKDTKQKINNNENEKLEKSLSKSEKEIILLAKKSKNDFLNHETRINNLETSVSSLESAGSSSAEISALETRVGTTESNISSLQNAQSTNSSNISTLQNLVNTNAGSISSLQTSVSSVANSVSLLQTSINTNASDINDLETTSTDHETRISALESAGGSGGGSGSSTVNAYGTTVAEINALEQELLENEEIFNFGGRFKFLVNHKGANGPKVKIFTRINPKFNSRFRGKIFLYCSDLPSDLTSTTCSLQINNGSAKTLTLTPMQNENHTFEIPFDFFTDKISNCFEIVFNSSNLASLVLDFAEVESQNTNFLVLNRDMSYGMTSFIRQSTGEKMAIFSENTPTRKRYFSSYDNSTTFPPNANSNWWNYPTISGWRINKATIIHSVTKTIGAIGGSFGLYSKIFGCICDENNNFRTYNNYNSLSTTTTRNNFTMISGGYNSGVATAQIFAVANESKQFFIGKDTLEIDSSPPTLNHSSYPNSFIQANVIGVHNIMFMTDNNSKGYILLHETGEILYINEKHATYFLKIDVGTQPVAYYHTSTNTIYVYYQKNNTVFRKILEFDSTTQKWNLSPNTKMFKGCDGVFEGSDTILAYHDNDAWISTTV